VLRKPLGQEAVLQELRRIGSYSPTTSVVRRSEPVRHS